MKTAIILIFATLILSSIFSLLLNFSSSKSVRHIPVDFHLLRNCSLDNAVTVNHASSFPNSPVRPDGEDFFDGLTSELTNERNDATLAKKIINIRHVI